VKQEIDAALIELDRRILAKANGTNLLPRAVGE
jgi:hypothetical protein